MAVSRRFQAVRLHPLKDVTDEHDYEHEYDYDYGRQPCWPCENGLATRHVWRP
jgi:hypothetical protein